MKSKFFSFIGLVLAASFSVNAAIIQIESVDVNPAFAESDLQAYWDTITPTSTLPVTDLSGIFFEGVANNNTLYKMTIDFNPVEPILVDFTAGLDAGVGAEVFVNGVLTVDVTDDIWWELDFNNDDAISLDNILFTAGANTIELYWAELRNSGGNGFLLSESPVPVNAPTMAILFGLGVAGMAFRRIKK